MRRTARISVAALAVTTLALTACGRGDDAATGDASATAVDTSELSGTVTVWAMGTEGEALGDFAQAFTEENPDVTIDVTAVPWDAAHDKIATAIAADEVPDVSMIGTTWMGEFATSGGLDPTPPDLIDESTFFEGAWGSTEVGGTSYAVPWYVETRVLYVDTALAEQAGVSPTPATWDDLTATAAGMQSAGAQWGINLQPGQTGAWQTFLPFAWQAGAEIMNEDNTEFTFDSPEFVKALTYYQSFFTDGVAPKELPEGTLEPDFVAGKIGAFSSGPWHIGLLEESGGEAFMDGVTLAPMPADETQASFIGGSNLAVFKSAENRDAAWAFVQWLSQPDVQADWYATTSDLPAVQSAWEEGDLASDERLAVFGEQMTTAQAPPSIPTWEQIANVIDTELEKVCKTGMDPQEAATAIQQQAESIGTGL
ncbi:sugar ABC transporter substrate-binding protein [Cellulomonas humilata]|uniref:Multiple sugar transport system substrate-binding protein n=1 Tax=Cellulomonas humilata TaxID=144055 RepID=A0ABU0EIC2_9CELL|nr:sugar ABC transporter substrate-binding protein [Cellulomonas humilata]MDQ0375014.1 multiple sugar transport system substrate-binding protein [Cellulomonas humilata]